MNQKLFPLLVAILLLSNSSFVSAAEKANPRPNIVFILMDDLRWDGLGCTGSRVAKTPNIDRIAKEGALFENFFVSIPLCSPSRGSFLTGQYPHRTGVIDNTDHSALSHTLVTFPRLLHDAGYETAYVGKWHMGNDDSPRPGFDHWVSFKGQGVYENPMINVDGKASRVNGYITDILDGHVVNFLKQKHDKPFALYLAHKAVHGPFTPADRHKELYSSPKFPIAPSVNDSREGKLALTRKIDGEPPRQAKRKSDSENDGDPSGKFNVKGARAQLQCLASVDDGVGEILKALENSGQLDNTMIVFTSDNGFFWGEHGLGDKRWPYEESIRDPLLVRFPKLIKPGTKLDQMVLNIDIAPTFLELAGVTIPKEVQGKSLLPLFKNPKTGWRKSFLTEYFQEKQYLRCPTWQTVRTDRWKLIHYSELDGMDELYDLKQDPFEMKNLVKEKRSANDVKRMQEELRKLQQEF